MSLERVVFATRRLNPQVPPTLAVQLKATRGRGGLQDCLASTCPGLPPTSHLCQVPQRLLQPLSLLCLQGRLLLEPQGFLEWYWGDKEREVRFSALVCNSTLLPLWPPSHWVAMPTGQPYGRPPQQLQCPHCRLGPEKYSILPQGHTAYWRRAGHRTGPGPTHKDD